MKIKKVIFVTIFALLGCEEISGINAVDANVVEQNSALGCTVYLNPEAEKEGLGTSWDDSVGTIDDAIHVAEEKLKEADSCEIWTNELGKKAEYEKLLSKFDGRIAIKEKSSNSESTYNNYEEGNAPSSSVVGKTTTSSTSMSISNPVIGQAHAETELKTTGTLLSYFDEKESDYTPFSTCGCDRFSTRVEISSGVDADGNPGTGSLEIANSLRIDGNEIITNTGEPLSLQYNNNGDLRVDNETFVVDASTNRVGIGTRTPSYTLDVRGDINLDGDDGYRSEIHLPGSSITGWVARPPAGAAGIDIKAYILSMNTGTFTIRNSEDWVLSAGTSSKTVSINGTLTAETIKAEELTLEANLADYVFQDGYDLRSLEEVEAFIDENNHLPDMPSEADVDAHGLSVADFNNLLLQKIEELTLHMIEQNKKIKTLEKQIALNKKP